ncbi:MAG: phage baseplate assembly protein [Pseudomonadota bacterium]
MIQQIWHRLQLLFAQGRGVRISHDKIQVYIMDGETPPNVDRVEMYGYSYRPHPGCQAYVVFPSGDRSRGFALIVGDKQYNLLLAEGEVALHDDLGQKVHLKRTGIVVETPLDIDLRGRNIKIHATESFQFDVNGPGQRWDGQGVEKWQDDDIPKPHHPHSPPEI